jgi:endopeptidase La
MKSNNEIILINDQKGKNVPSNPKDISSFIRSKISTFQEIIKKTCLSVQKYKYLEILGSNEINICMTSLELLFSQLENMLHDINNNPNGNLDIYVSKLQEINNDLSSLLKSFGTYNIDDLITICFGGDFLNTIITSENKERYEVIKKYVHPIGYKVMAYKEKRKKKEIAKNKIVEDFTIVESADNFDCFDLSRTSKSFQTKVYGIKIAIQHEPLKKSLIICGIVDDINIECMNYPFIQNKISDLSKNKPNDPDFNNEIFSRFLSSLSTKEILIYSNSELYNKYIGIINSVSLLKQKQVSILVKDFITDDLYNQRNTIIKFLLHKNDIELQYLAYLLYDLLSNDNNGNIDTLEQTQLFDSLPWTVKKFFKDAMKNTIKYTHEIGELDHNKIPLEQQICLMKVDDSIKEKAFMKLKEVKAKSEDSGNKPRQFLEGLLKVPFNVFREEKMLHVMSNVKSEFSALQDMMKNYNSSYTCKQLNNITGPDIFKHVSTLESEINDIIKNHEKEFINNLGLCKRKELLNIINIFNKMSKSNKKITKINTTGMKIEEMKKSIVHIISLIDHDIDYLAQLSYDNDFTTIKKIHDSLTNIMNIKVNINSDIVNSRKILDEAVYGHDKAKRQVERIIGQWVNGENTGYSFGFEGPPGVGKTSLAKNGIAQCLNDDDGTPRPFAFIAIGGSSNGSTLEGHNYTYVGSTWGRIVDILIEKKCMNPIIFIDELDKISMTEHGKEIIGILTHLTDPTQNDTFQDKYFSGIDIDLSKALFIFSYNDPGLIDKILLDRIHRVKFDHLTVADKLVITHKHIMPEITKKMGLQNNITITDEVITFLIKEYTYEPGVRKLKELLFEIIGEINLEILAGKNEEEIPIKITCEDIKSKFLKERYAFKPKKIHEESRAGIINGLWANALGKGGIIPIESHFFPSATLLDFKLTGMQGDVMKESMNVARTLAWNLTDDKIKKDLIKSFEDTKSQGIHIHCPEGATPKDGPSAGTAITTVLYSLINNRKIKNTVAITGEMNLQGKVTAIGGLDLKILGGIAAGVTQFLFPKENEKDYNMFLEKYAATEDLSNISFHQVETIQEVFELVFEDN